jgi:hypothetical protein
MHLEDLVTELADRIIVLEKRENTRANVEPVEQSEDKNAKANDTTSQRSSRTKLAQSPTQLAEQVNDLTVKVDSFLDRLEEVEVIVE